MEDQIHRRNFLKGSSLAIAATAMGGCSGTEIGEPAVVSSQHPEDARERGAAISERAFNSQYRGEDLANVAFPLGGIGAGMVCLEGTGRLSHISVHNVPDLLNEPPIFAAISVKGSPRGVKVLEGPVPEGNRFGRRGDGSGGQFSDELGIPKGRRNFGLPRFAQASVQGYFRSGWFDPETMAWNAAVSGGEPPRPLEADAPGASLFVPFVLEPGDEKTIPLLMTWYVPLSAAFGEPGRTPAFNKKIQQTTMCKIASVQGASCGVSEEQWAKDYYRPWYAGQFSDIAAMTGFWQDNYPDLRQRSKLFADAFQQQTLPAEVIEAVAANLTILKSPTVLRLQDGRLWGWEGSNENAGCCPGSCTHVWNYAQALPHLFPRLERSLRETEFYVNQNEEGHQNFRTRMPLATPSHDMYAAADGQLGGIVKAYRDWRISGDSNWIKELWPSLRQSMEYCIDTWDPREKGLIEEPHHNTYDIEFWGADGMHATFYLGALNAMLAIGNALGKKVDRYHKLAERGRVALETDLYNGDYFYQQVKWKSLQAPDPVTHAKGGLGRDGGYSPEALEILEKEGPKYQYGTGCLADGVLGDWMARTSGLPGVANGAKVKSHLESVYHHNFMTDLSDHANPQRATYGFGNEGGLLNCTWPLGNKPLLPFIYSDEVWTGIEYQVASHLMMMGEVDKGLEIVREVRNRYDGRKRNPFNEFECGSWYARAMASYALLQGLTGVRYDAVDQALYMNSKVGDSFTSFLATETGFGLVGLKDGKPFVDVKSGHILIREFVV